MSEQADVDHALGGNAALLDLDGKTSLACRQLEVLNCFDVARQAMGVHASRNSARRQF